MKDYSNYYPSYKDKLKNDGEVLFHIHCRGFEGFNVLIDGNSYEVIIQQHTNPMDEYKEDRLLTCLQNTLIHKGSEIIIKDEDMGELKNWLTVTNVDFNGITKSAKIRECNNSLKFRYNGLDINTPCILEDSNSMNIDEETRTESPDSYYIVTLQFNNDTKKLPLGARFIFGSFVYKLIGVNDITTPGLLKFRVRIDDERVGKDNFETGYADNSELKSDNYTLKIVNNNISAKIGENPIQLNIQLSNNGVNQTSKSDDFIYQSDNTNICTVDLNGLVSFIGVGVCNISVQYKNDTIIKDSISITVEQANIPAINKYTITINGSNIINKQTSSKINHPSEKYTAIINNNGVQDTSKTVKWELLNLDGITPLTNGLVSMTVLNGTHTQVFSTPTVGKFKLKASLTDDSSIFAIMQIEVTY